MAVLDAETAGERTRLRDYEKSALMSLFSAEHILAQIEEKAPSLFSRNEKSRGDLHRAAAFLGKCLNTLLATVQPSTLERMKFEMLSVNNVIVYNNKPSQPMPDDWKTIKADDLLTIMEATQETCKFCTKDKQEQKRCKLAKALDGQTGITLEGALPYCAYFED